jgi:hypothetical protein
VLAIDNVPFGGGFAGPGWVGVTMPGNHVFGADLSTPPHESRRGSYVGGGTIPNHPGVVVHEIGHTLHWPHSLNGTDEYGNVYDVMSRVSGSASQHTLAWNRYSAGWIDPNQVHVHTGGTATVNLDRPGTAGVQMAVLRDANANLLTTLEARPATGRDAALPQAGVVAHTIDLRPCSRLASWGLSQCISLWRTYRQVHPGVTTHVIAAGQTRQLAGANVTVEGTTATGFRVRLGGGNGAPTDPLTSCGLRDVPANTYFSQAACWAKALGITTGYAGDQGRFAPGVALDRAQMATMLWRMAGSP